MLGGPYWTYRSNEVLVPALTLLPLPAHLSGGFVSGRMAFSSPEMNGALSEIVAVIKGSTLCSPIWLRRQTP